MYFITKRKFLFFGIVIFSNFLPLLTPAVAQTESLKPAASPLMMFGRREAVKNNQPEAYSEDCWREHYGDPETSENSSSLPSRTTLEQQGGAENPAVTTLSYGADLLNRNMSDSLWGILGPERPDPSLTEFRDYVANPENEGTHAAVLSNGSVVAIPSTWHGQLLHMRYGDSHELTSQRFSAALSNALGRRIAGWTYSEKLRKNAAVRHSDVLQQQLVANILKNTVHVLNPFLQKIKITVRLPEQSEVVSEATDTDDLPDQQLPPGSSKTNRHRSSSAAAVEAEEAPWWKFFANAVSVKAKVTDIVSHVVNITPGLVNKAFKEKIEVSVALNENALIRIGGVSHALIKEVLEKADTLIVKNTTRAELAAQATKMIKIQLERFQQQHKMSYNGQSKDLIPSSAGAEKNYQRLSELGKAYHARPSSSASATIISADPVTAALVEALSENVMKPLTKASDFSHQLQQVKHLFKKEILAQESSPFSHKETSPWEHQASTEKIFYEATFRCHKKAQDKAVYLHLAAAELLPIIDQMLEIITKSLLPSLANAEEAENLSIDELDPTLKKLAEQLEAELQAIRVSDADVESLKYAFRKEQEAYLTAMQQITAEAVTPQKVSGMAAKAGRSVANSAIDVANALGQTLVACPILSKLSSQSEVKRMASERAAFICNRIEAILANTDFNGIAEESEDGDDLEISTTSLVRGAIGSTKHSFLQSERGDDTAEVEGDVWRETASPVNCVLESDFDEK